MTPELFEKSNVSDSTREIHFVYKMLYILLHAIFYINGLFQLYELKILSTFFNYKGHMSGKKKKEIHLKHKKEKRDCFL